MKLALSAARPVADFAQDALAAYLEAHADSASFMSASW